MATNTRIQWVLSPSELAICCPRRTTPIPFNAHRVWDNCGNSMFIPPYLCASFISYEGIDYHLPCEWSAVFVLPPEKTSAHSGRTEPSIWSLWLCWRGWPRRWQLEQGWTWLWQRQGEINLERVRVSLYFFLSVIALGYVSLKVVSATDIPLQNWKWEEESTRTCSFL